MKNWTIFKWAAKRLKVTNGAFVKCFRNDILLRIMNLSGVTPKDCHNVININSKKKGR